MARVLVMIEVEVGGTTGDALEVVNSVLDGGLPQDAFSESGFVDIRVIDAIVAPHPDPARVFREYSLRHFTRNPIFGGH